MSGALTVQLRRRQAVRDRQGFLTWETAEMPLELAPGRTALLVCDVWDRHGCRGAEERLARLRPRMNEVVRAARSSEMLIVHAPSDTMDYYAGSPARERVLDAPAVCPPADLAHDDPPLPIDDTDGGCDTDRNPGGVHEPVWTRQHPAIEIDQTRDAISDDGRELLNLYRQRGIETLIILGVHATMCILNRTFAIKQMVRWGFDVVLLRDLTDTMYNPARAPYVSHEEGTRLTLAYVEAFWCPTMDSADLLRGPKAGGLA